PHPADTSYLRPTATITNRQPLRQDDFKVSSGERCLGGGVTTAMGKLWPKELIGVHLNLPVLFDAPLVGTPTPEGQKVLKQIADFQANGTAYSAVQRTSPETIGTGLTDSPAGQAAWIYEKFGLWTDSNHNPESIWSYDEMLDDIMLY
ncbi:epoxide hydrolase, partial [Streptomyces fagopyri]